MAQQNPGAGTTAMRLKDQGFFWVGVERRKMDYGTIATGQMYVQYLIPATVTQPLPVVLVHGGGGQGTHYMGSGSGKPGWAHYFVQQGYRTYIVDRPGHGRAPYHPDALGPLSPVPTMEGVAGELAAAASSSTPRWPGTGRVGDPLLDQFQAGQNAAPQDQAKAHALWASRGAELLDRIGPAIVIVHSAGGPFAWVVADQRPALVKAIVAVEPAGPPFGALTWGLSSSPVGYDPPVSDPKELATRDVTPPAGSNVPAYKLQADPPRKLKNLTGIPISFVLGESSPRHQQTDPPSVEFLRQAGCTVDFIRLEERGIRGNGHFMMLETNNREIFDVIHAWIATKARA
jgi:pimeloyl-ACP methyl ester carboxylesterase